MINTIILSIIAALIAAVSVVLIKLIKVQQNRDAVLSHRELWLYYMDNKDLANILSNNNEKDTSDIPTPQNLTEKQYRFLVLFLNHMEMMLPSYTKFKKDWVGLFKNDCLRYVYQNTKSYRNKKFCKLVDGIIASYNI